MYEIIYPIRVGYGTFETRSVGNGLCNVIEYKSCIRLDCDTFQRLFAFGSM